ncbi:UDP-N-acetylmuramoyl-L-alanyl-D-glutamate--2,6-diaminopimelate ligase [Levilactobacillus zymae]|uniref:UDP-N-acetylmuramoyl-L-alanyl-D-glutamate--2, 6-diaminopimelate ligase n=1 Tax=Levilactobacillus zymae TaxID=267363 RepID=UPI0028B67BF3|nr:UDP-N-acetylmuramoyl-L-alanyl-D-glutamate--2,6-diaminopimelate ligase [Levilactobacillus zymae]MDT6979287.1 UDP-N-acetylmuramoyl-L-alanyl-D-glutamate--2,6-diaminopimelate ligase [Levilactobacillus zymae]
MNLSELIVLLQEHHLFVRTTSSAQNLSFDSLEYDSRKIGQNGLFICKGKTFSVDYLKQAVTQGATAYLSETDYSHDVDVPGIIVNDVRKAMSLTAQLFFKFPQNEMFLIAYTGTKGKTTSTYFTRNILEHAFPKQAAMFSTIDRIVGNAPEDEFKAHLTTAESLDLFHEMREAADNGQKYLVLEVASQAYLLDRVYGLRFNVGIFLDITPDHIGINEHPNFANYLFCKQQLMLNSDYCIINADTDHFPEVLSAAKVSSAPDHIFTYSQTSHDADVTIVNDEASLTDSTFSLTVNSENAELASLGAQFHVSVPGDFNQSNATAAILATHIAQAQVADMQYGLSHTTVPGRMEFIKTQNHGTIYIDYAHDWGSMNALMHFLRTQFPDQRIIALLGSTGDKGEDRREGFARALNDYADIAFLTADDPGHEDPVAIAKEIDSHIDHDKVTTHIIPKREDAIHEAISMATNTDLVVLAGKGEDAYQKINGVDTPYASDPVVARNVLGTLANEA